MFKKLSLLLILGACSTASFAESTVGFSLSREHADIGNIASFNIYSQFTDSRTNFGYQLGTGLSAAEITDYDGYVDHYTAWEGFGRIGFFSDVSLYLEAGIDIGEMLWLDDDHHHDHYYDEHHNDVDNFIGAGFGLSQDHFDLRVFSRYRYIDGYNLHDNQDVFTGVEFSLHF
ncbi:hypothetical protein [Pleionea sediminis]|uniref:hypothetical protein n=1 Tax=Pleionea sediminis TaxID=2569479 RepID=UPI001186A12D|nr:hypothetical protein [Pleionea sediminis]